eukprot:643172_1
MYLRNVDRLLVLFHTARQILLSEYSPSFHLMSNAFCHSLSVSVQYFKVVFFALSALCFCHCLSYFETGVSKSPNRRKFVVARKFAVHKCTKLSTQSIANIKHKIAERESDFKPSIKEIKQYMVDEALVDNTSLFQHNSKSINRKAVKSFCERNNIQTRKLYDRKPRPQHSPVLSELQILVRSGSDTAVYQSMPARQQLAIQSTCIIKTTTNKKKRKQQKKGAGNRNIDFSNKVWDGKDVLDAKAKAKAKKTNQVTKRKRSRKRSSKEEEDATTDEETDTEDDTEDATSSEEDEEISDAQRDENESDNDDTEHEMEEDRNHNANQIEDDNHINQQEDGDHNDNGSISDAQRDENESDNDDTEHEMEEDRNHNANQIEDDNHINQQEDGDHNDNGSISDAQRD